MSDFNLQNHLNNIMGFGRSEGKTKTDDYANADNALGEHMKASMDRGAEGLGFVLPPLKFLTNVLSGNSAAAGLESEGIAGKNIMPSSGGLLPDAQGGFLARLLAILGKGRDITDHTGGVGGGEGIGGGEGFAGAGGGSGDFSFMDSSSFASASANFSSYASDMMDYGSGNFGATGNLQPMATPDMGAGAGAGMNV